MDRSLYPEGVEVNQVDLERTEDTKAFHIIKRHSSVSIPGVVNSQVTINLSNNTLIDIGAFSGFIPDGEYIESSITQVAQQLADYTSGTINYVLGIYTEIDSDLKPHETNGNSYPTSATRSHRLRVLSETEYNALPDIDDNFSNDSRGRALILAKVTARGVGIGLTSADITSPTIFGSAVSAVKNTDNITGVEIYSIDRTTNSGVGYLRFTASSQELEWKSPNSADVYGSPIVINVTGTYQLSSGLSKTISVLVTASSLPSTDQTDTVAIANIYAQTVNKFTSEDLHHRSLIGSGVPTVSNPHGTTLEDLSVSSGLIETHQNIFHDNGILRTSNANVLKATVFAGSVPDSLTITLPIIGDAFYIKGYEFNTLTSGTITFGDIVVDAHAVFDVYAVEGTGVASLEKRERVRYTTVSPPLLASFVQLAALEPTLPATSSARIKYDNTNKTLEFDSGSGFGTPILVPTSGADYIRLFDNADNYWIDLYVEQLSLWSGIVSDVTENLTVAAPLTSAQAKSRLPIASVLFSGSASGFLGNGFGAGNLPNYLINNRLFGTTSNGNLRDDTGLLVNTPSGNTNILGSTVYRRIGISDDPAFKHPLDALHIFSSGRSRILLESGVTAKTTLGRIWSIQNNTTGRFSISRSKARVVGTVDDFQISTGGQFGFNSAPVSTSLITARPPTVSGQIGMAIIFPVGSPGGPVYGLYGDASAVNYFQSYGVYGVGSSGVKGVGTSGLTTVGVEGVGGTVNGVGGVFYGGGVSVSGGDGLRAFAGTGGVGNGVTATGSGVGAGIQATAGATGVGGYFGAAGGHGILVVSTSATSYAGNFSSSFIGLQATSGGGSQVVHGVVGISFASRYASDAGAGVYGASYFGGRGVIAENLNPNGYHASFRMVPQVAPGVSYLADGDMWVTTGGLLQVRLAGNTRTVTVT